MSDKVKIDYVFSGTSMMRLIPSKAYTDTEYLNRRATLIGEGVKSIERTLNARLKSTDVTLSLLYNAYVESKFGDIFSSHKNFGFKNVYADSGGLQVITQGKMLTEDIKDDIYTAQDISNVAFCFDEIPVEKISTHIELNGSNRASVSSKVFNASRFVECAKKTAENVKLQLSSLKHSRVSYIIQGNTYNDMIKWFDIAAEILGDDIEKLYGIALADTCMGNGELETCDMLYAAAVIFKKHPRLFKNIHLLGVGSGKRMLPAIILCQNGFLKDVILSSDSSSQSMSYIMGKTVSINEKLSDNESFKMFGDELSEVFSKYVDNFDSSDLAEFVLKNNRQAGTVEELCYNDPEHRYHKIGGVICPLYNTWCVNKMFMDIERMINSVSYITLLKHVTSLEDYVLWRSRNYSKLQSKRMTRKRVTLLDMVGI